MRNLLIRSVSQVASPRAPHRAAAAPRGHPTTRHGHSIRIAFYLMVAPSARVALSGSWARVMAPAALTLT